MQPLSLLKAEHVAPLRGFLFDLDDTLLDHGLLSTAGLDALYRLQEAGLALFAVTGRSAGWGSVIAHQWPISGAIVENGNLAFVRDGGRVKQSDPLTETQRAARNLELASVVATLSREFPELAASDDAWLRSSDFTFDIGEYRRVPAEVVQRVRQRAQELGAATIASSVHLHVSLDRADKASGAVRVLGERFGLDPLRVLREFSFIGDSENDAACFNAFKLTFGVKNLSGRPTLAPLFLASQERALGFCEVVERLLARRAELW